MDRNVNNAEIDKHDGIVALRKESVDRNIALMVLLLIVPKVALRKESVDRNNS